MHTGKRCKSVHFYNVGLAILMSFFIASCGSSSDGGGGKNSNVRNVTAALGDNLKNVSLTAGQQTEVKFTYTLPAGITSYESFSVDLADTMQYVTVSSSPVTKKFNIWDKLKMFAGLTEAMASSTGQITAFISYAGDPNVCSSSYRFGPYNITGDIGSHPSSETSSASPSNIAVDITNSGSFEICLVIVSPVDAFLTVSNVSVELKSCDQSPSNVLGTWTGTYSCTNFGTVNDVDQTVTLTISKNPDGSYSYTDEGGAEYSGHLCGNTFKFNGGKSGIYTESGTFVLNDNGTASKTSTWNSIPPGISGGNCTDSLHR